MTELTPTCRLLATVAFSLLGVLGGCASGVRAHFQELRVGLTTTEVEALLGRPSIVIPPEVAEDGTVLAGPRWQYGDNLSTTTTAAAFPRTVPDRVWVVWFDPEERVSSWRPPIVEATSSVESSDDQPGRTPLFGSPTPPRNR